MKLIRLDDWRTGLFVQLPEGPHLVDVVSSLGVLLPEHPIANGVLDAMLKNRGSWAPLIEHWDLVGPGLRQLASAALTNPDHPRLAMRPFGRIRVNSSSLELQRIASLELTELAEMAETAACSRTETRAEYCSQCAQETAPQHHNLCYDEDRYWWNRQG